MFNRLRLKCGENAAHAKPFCKCFSKEKHVPSKQLSPCVCGEDHEVTEWKWIPDDSNENPRSSWVILSENRKQVMFHPCFSSGTAAVRGDTPMLLNNHYYWEIKILTQTYGTDIMVGVGTLKVDMRRDRFKFMSLLGQDCESYGLSYRGGVRHGGERTLGAEGFCRGSIVGVRLDLWQGTLEFYVNRKPQGVSFYNLRRHDVLYPMMSSTTAQSCMRLTYAASWRASLLVDAAKVLAASARDRRLPPGLQYTERSMFWLTMPSEGTAEIEEEEAEAPTSTPQPKYVLRRRRRRSGEAWHTAARRAARRAANPNASAVWLQYIREKLLWHEEAALAGDGKSELPCAQ